MAKHVAAYSRRKVLAGGAAALALSGTGNGRARVPGQTKFDRERFADDCRRAHDEGGMPAVQEVLTSAVRDHRAVLGGLGEPAAAGLDVILQSPTLTIFAAHWTPQMNLLPHDHAMAALIGIYTGREDNIVWHDGPDGLKAREAKCLFEGDVASLSADAIHSVTNPLLRFTGGIHIYDGDFFGAERSQWDPETLAREPSDGDSIRAMFARENERFAARRN